MNCPGLGVCEAKWLRRFEVLSCKFLHRPRFFLIKQIELQRPAASQLGCRKALLTAVEKRVNTDFSQNFPPQGILTGNARPQCWEFKHVLVPPGC